MTASAGGSAGTIRFTPAIALVGVLGLYAACTPHAGADAEVEVETEADIGAAPLPSAAEIEQLLQAFDVPGLAMATLTACEVDGVIVAGSAKLGLGPTPGAPDTPDTPVTPLTAFEAASLSKAVFAWLTLTLVDEGVIDLDRPIAETFDYPRIPDKTEYAKITPRMVLTHRTGLPNWVDLRVAFHDRTAPIPFESEPGTAYSYSGEAFQLLQAFVERETGMTLQQLFRERLGAVMPHSTFARPLPDGVAPSRGYESAADPESGRDMTNLYPLGMAASSLATTAGDYAAFISHVCRGGNLSSDTYADMLTPWSPVPRDRSFAPAAYGLGWMIAEVDEGTFIGHAGNNDEYRAIAGFIRETGDGIVILTNGAHGEALIESILLPPS